MSDRVVPALPPKQSEEQTRDILSRLGVTSGVAVLGVRGYYRDTMGIAGQNDIGIFDDAFFVVSRNVHASFNGNTDPSFTGMNPKLGKPYAHLRPGVYEYALGKHRGYDALVQAGPVEVLRIPDPPGIAYEETGWFGINIHKAGRLTTTSEGCQTIWGPQWPAFIALMKLELKRAGTQRCRYALIEP